MNKPIRCTLCHKIFKSQAYERVFEHWFNTHKPELMEKMNDLWGEKFKNKNEVL